MEIVRIFANALYSFRFEENPDDEFIRLMELWTDPQYLYQFIKEHAEDCPKNVRPAELTHQIIEHANQIDDALYEISRNSSRLEIFFKPLHNQEYQQVIALSQQKGRKIDAVIT